MNIRLKLVLGAFESFLEDLEGDFDPELCWEKRAYTDGPTTFNEPSSSYSRIVVREKYTPYIAKKYFRLIGVLP